MFSYYMKGLDMVGCPLYLRVKRSQETLLDLSETCPLPHGWYSWHFVLLSKGNYTRAVPRPFLQSALHCFTHRRAWKEWHCHRSFQITKHMPAFLNYYLCTAAENWCHAIDWKKEVICHTECPEASSGAGLWKWVSISGVRRRDGRGEMVKKCSSEDLTEHQDSYPRSLLIIVADTLPQPMFSLLLPPLPSHTHAHTHTFSALSCFGSKIKRG